MPPSDHRRPLSPREREVLAQIVAHYIQTGVPVSSRAIAKINSESLSPATLRSIMADLEEAGYITHPHTSAGRVPTDHGYRYYVESIVDQVPLPQVEQLMIRHQFGQVEFASEHWFRLAASTLAGVTRSAGLATAAKPQAAHVRRIDLVSINERLASLILVLREGSIKQSLMTLDEPVDQATLNEVAAQLNAQVAGLTAAAAEARLAGLATSDVRDELVTRIGERIVRTLREYDATLIEEVFSDGLLNVMSAPEFAQSDKLRRVFSALENRTYLGQLVGSVAGTGRVHVFIGAENASEEMHDVSLVLAPYGRPNRAVGVVGVLGPTRMSYPQAIGTVRFVSGLMNELVDHLYA